MKREVQYDFILFKQLSGQWLDEKHVSKDDMPLSDFTMFLN